MCTAYDCGARDVTGSNFVYIRFSSVLPEHTRLVRTTFLLVCGSGDAQQWFVIFQLVLARIRY